MFGKHTFGAWIWALMLTVACLLPGKSLPREPVLNADKIFHTVAFGLLAYLWAWGWQKQVPGSWLYKNARLLSLLLTIAFGGLIEVLQETLAQNRSADWLDFLFDSLGALAGVGLYSLLTGRKEKI